MYNIPLSIRDNRTFQDLALLVDRPDFQNKYLDALFNEGKKSDKYFTGSDYFLKSKLYDLATEIVLTYKYPFGFKKALMALGSNKKITDNDVKECYIKFLVLPPNFGNYPVPPNVISIFVNPYGLNDQQEQIEKQIHKVLKSKASKMPKLSSVHPLSLSIKHEIKNHRKWYLEQKIDGVSTIDLVSRYKKTGNTIDKGISDYLKLLRSPI